MNDRDRCIEVLRKLNAKIFAPADTKEEKRRAAILELKRAVAQLSKALEQLDENLR